MSTPIVLISVAAFVNERLETQKAIPEKFAQMVSKNLELALDAFRYKNVS